MHALAIDVQQLHLTLGGWACRDVPAKASNSNTDDAETDNSNLKVWLDPSSTRPLSHHRGT